MGCLTFLGFIFIKDNQLSALPDSFSRLWALRDPSKLQDIRPGQDVQEFFRAVNLAGNSFVTFPPQLQTLFSLALLDLSYNTIKEIPEWIKDITGLKVLKLGDNQIDKIPEAITNFQYLHTLNLMNNRLTKLPERIGSLPLERLFLSGNQITYLPESITGLSQLYELDIRNNPLGKLDNGSRLPVLNLEDMAMFEKSLFNLARTLIFASKLYPFLKELEKKGILKYVSSKDLLSSLPDNSYVKLLKKEATDVFRLVCLYSDYEPFIPY